MTAATGQRGAGVDLTLAQVRKASFYQLVRVLTDVSWPDEGSGFQLPGVRFKSDPSLAFPVSDVSRVEVVEEDGEQYHVVTCTFMGLCGVGSPLPVAYLMELGLEGNEVVRDFLDIANHRLMVLFFRAWQRYRYLFQLAPDRADALSTLLLALGGFHREGLDAVGGITPRFLIYWSGLLSQRPASAHTLETMLRAVVHPGVTIEECVLRRVRIPEGQTFRLDPRRARLGRNVTIGRSVWDRTGKFRVWVKAITLAQLPDFLPGGDRLERLDRVVRLVLNARLDYDVALELNTRGMAGLPVGGRGVRLHLTTWLGRPRSPRVTLMVQGVPGERRTVRMVSNTGV